MIDQALTLTLAMFVVAMLLSAWRLLVGPDVLDRVLALDTLYVNASALLVAAGVRFAEPALFDAALVIALLGFVGTVALARHQLQGTADD